MATAEELLRVTPEEDKIFYIDLNTRQIIIPKSVTQLGVESDDDVKAVTFSMPRHYYGNDLSEFNFYINYLNAKKEGDLFEVFKDDMTVEEDTLTFEWVVGRNALAFKGNAIFNVCMKLIPRDENGDALRDEDDNVIVEKELNTTIATLPVLEGLETGEEIAEQYVDIMMQWEEALFGAGRSVMRDIILRGDEVLETLTEFSIEQQRQIVLKGSEVSEALTNLSIEQQRQIVLKGSEVVNTLEQIVPVSVSTYIAENADDLQGPAGEPFEYEDFTPAQLEALKGPKGNDGVSPTVKISKSGKVTTITITDATGAHSATINDGADGMGAGDMLRSVYDTDGDGIVDNAEKLGGKAASEYALKSDIPEEAETAEVLVFDSLNSATETPSMTYAEVRAAIDAGIPMMAYDIGRTTAYALHYWTDNQIVFRAKINPYTATDYNTTVFTYYSDNTWTWEVDRSDEKTIEELADLLASYRVAEIQANEDGTYESSMLFEDICNYVTQLKQLVFAVLVDTDTGKLTTYAPTELSALPNGTMYGLFTSAYGDSFRIDANNVVTHIPKSGPTITDDGNGNVTITL